jgi:hypothetical protein
MDALWVRRQLVEQLVESTLEGTWISWRVHGLGYAGQIQKPMVAADWRFKQDAAPGMHSPVGPGHFPDEGLPMKLVRNPQTVYRAMIQPPPYREFYMGAWRDKDVPPFPVFLGVEKGRPTWMYRREVRAVGAEKYVYVRPIKGPPISVAEYP